jgi:hypothetical protein
LRRGAKLAIGIEKVGCVFTFAAAAYNLVWMRNLRARPVMAA